MNDSTAIATTTIPEMVAVDSDEILNALATLDAVSDLLLDLHKVADLVDKTTDSLRVAAFGRLGNDDHPLWAQLDQLRDALRGHMREAAA